MPDFIKNNIGISLYNSNITICIFWLLILNQQSELKSDIQNAKIQVVLKHQFHAIIEWFYLQLQKIGTAMQNVFLLSWG